VIDRHMQEMMQSMVSSPQSFKRGPASRLGTTARVRKILLLERDHLSHPQDGFS
jgi:hypothetical protein